MVGMRGNSLCLPAVNFRKTTLYLHSSAAKRCFVEIRLIYVLFLIIWKMKFSNILLYFTKSKVRDLFVKVRPLFLHRIVRTF